MPRIISGSWKQRKNPWVSNRTLALQTRFNLTWTFKRHINWSTWLISSRNHSVLKLLFFEPHLFENNMFLMLQMALPLHPFSYQRRSGFLRIFRIFTRRDVFFLLQTSVLWWNILLWDVFTRNAFSSWWTFKVRAAKNSQDLGHPAAAWATSRCVLVDAYRDAYKRLHFAAPWHRKA